jgi:hypothetical protein
MELIKEIILKDPPTFYLQKKVRESREKGEDVFVKHYLTANLFYIQNVNYHIVSKITHECKIYLRDNIKYLPELEKCRIEIEYRHTKEIDLDNKAYFFLKLLLDILKTPTKRQLENAAIKNKEIITLNCLKDDTTKEIDDIRMKFERGEHCMIIRVYGRLKPQQEQMDLFFK